MFPFCANKLVFTPGAGDFQSTNQNQVTPNGKLEKLAGGEKQSHDSDDNRGLRPWGEALQGKEQSDVKESPLTLVDCKGCLRAMACGSFHECVHKSALAGVLSPRAVGLSSRDPIDPNTSEFKRRLNATPPSEESTMATSCLTAKKAKRVKDS